jgi:DinB superfamily
MTDKELQALRFPIGEFVSKPEHSAEEISGYISTIEAFPERIRGAVEGLTDKQLDTPYRPGGWSIRQVVHHVADSHLNSYIRFKLALTEDTPTIKPYYEDRWAELPEAKSGSVELSLPLLESLHKRWVTVLRAITPEQIIRKFYHPEQKKEFSIDWLMSLYAWHCVHHFAHITELKKRMSW